MANSAQEGDTAGAYKQGTLIYFDFGPPAQDGSDEALLKEKHYAVVVQMDGLSKSRPYPLLIACGLTSTRPKQMAGWVEVPATPLNGLDHTSFLDVKRIYTIRKDQVQRIVGELEWEKLQETKSILAQLFAIRAENILRSG